MDQLLRLEGWGDTNPPPDLPGLVNEGLRLFSWRAEYNRDTLETTTTSGTAEYTLTNPPDWKLVTQVIYNDTSVLEETTEQELDREAPLWLVQSAGTPTHFLISQPNTLRLHPKPDTSSVALDIRGVRTAAGLSASTDEPACPAVFHEGIALYGAWVQGKAYAVGEARERLAAYLEEANGYADECRNYLAGQESQSLQRIVRRRRAERIPLS